MHCGILPFRLFEGAGPVLCGFFWTYRLLLEHDALYFRFKFVSSSIYFLVSVAAISMVATYVVSFPMLDFSVFLSSRVEVLALFSLHFSWSTTWAMLGTDQLNNVQKLRRYFVSAALFKSYCLQMSLVVLFDIAILADSIR